MINPFHHHPLQQPLLDSQGCVSLLDCSLSNQPLSCKPRHLQQVTGLGGVASHELGGFGLSHFGEEVLDGAVRRLLFLGLVQHVHLAVDVVDAAGLVVVPDQQLHDLGEDHGRLSRHHLVAVGLHAVRTEPEKGIAAFGFDSQLLDATVAVDMVAVEDSSVALDLVAFTASDHSVDATPCSVRGLHLFQKVDQCWCKD